MKTNLKHWRQADGAMHTTWAMQEPTKVLPPFRTFQALSPGECARIIRSVPEFERLDGNYIARHLAKKQKLGQAGYIVPDKQNAWLYERCTSLMLAANKTYGYHCTGFVEALRVKRYAEGETIPWHQDYGFGPVADQSKLSLVIQLSRTSTYTGGRFEFLTYRAPKLQQGQAIVFPSLLPHRVCEVTKGERFSLVCWWNGPHYV
jgi:PKHD-type hydroxylase